MGRRLGFPLAPVFPVRLCPLPGSLYTVLLGYKESPVAEARLRFATIVGTLVHEFLLARAGDLRAAAGGPFDVALPVPSSRRPGPAPLARVQSLGEGVADAMGGVRWVPELLQRTVGSAPVAHMRPDAAGFGVRPGDMASLAGARALVLDDTYVSGARAQSAACALRHAGARAAVIVVIGRVLRPDRSARHADFLCRHAMGPTDRQTGASTE